MSVHIDPSGDDAAGDGTFLSPFQTLHRGLQAAADGDSIVLAAGLYIGPGNRDLEVPDRGLHFIGSEGREATTIDCENSGRFLVMTPGSGFEGSITGLTVRNASTSASYAFLYDVDEFVIRNCQVMSFSSSYVPIAGSGHSRFIGSIFSDMRGGHEASAMGFSGKVSMHDCTIERVYGYGEAVGVHGNFDATRCRLEANAIRAAVWVDGDSISVRDSQIVGSLGVNGVVQISDCEISQGGIWGWWGRGVETCLIERCQFSTSHYDWAAIETGTSGRWTVSESEFHSSTSLIVRAFSSGGITLTRCEISENTIPFGGSPYLMHVFADATLEECIIRDNWSPFGIHVETAGSLQIVRSTLCNNAPRSQVVNWGGSVTITNSILSFQPSQDLDDDNWPPVWCAGDGASVEVSATNIFGNFYGDWVGSCLDGHLGVDGNFSADPRFCDREAGNLTLDGSSPCLPGNHPDGLALGQIGALGHGCGAIQTKRISWGQLRAGVERQ